MHTAAVLRSAQGSTDLEHLTEAVVDLAQYRQLVAPLGGEIEAETTPSMVPLLRAGQRQLDTVARTEAPLTWKQLTRPMSMARLLALFSPANYIVGYNKVPSFNRANPRTLARFGLWLIQTGAAQSAQAWERRMWGLCLIGCSWCEIASFHFCRLCFRRAWPGRQHCEEHSQGRTDEVTRSAAYRRYRIAKKVLAVAESRGLSIAHRSSPEELLEFQKVALLLLLWPSLHQYDDDGAFHRFTLTMAPRVLARLGGWEALKLEYAELMKRLRNHIDPHEWWDGVWPSKIIAAEQWLELEAEVARGSRGVGKKTESALERALDYARAGKSRREIATLLGVSASTLRQWVRRYPELKEALTR